MIIDPDRRGGWPPKLKPADLKGRSALLADPEINLEDMARRLDISPATFANIPAASSSMGLADYADSKGLGTRCASAAVRRPLLSAGRVRTVVAQTPALPAR
ncbi:hypothetical protein GGD56_000502 [Rhizobium mongolense]|uniref:Uncharacterized protein n=1 Tax=Rhizobium mongolense TaxID=57676 RepID=A0ABR6IFN3_9HYPH|nr:hypothetical protein [Rhizobium mongolense]